jgi:hypothetical protein
MNIKTLTLATTATLVGLGMVSIATASAAPLADGTLEGPAAKAVAAAPADVTAASINITPATHTAGTTPTATTTVTPAVATSESTANGGGAYAERPDLAPSWAQDEVAYNYYQTAGWSPWECA